MTSPLSTRIQENFETIVKQNQLAYPPWYIVFSTNLCNFATRLQTTECSKRFTLLKCPRNCHKCSSLARTRTTQCNTWAFHPGLRINVFCAFFFFSAGQKICACCNYHKYFMVWSCLRYTFHSSCSSVTFLQKQFKHTHTHKPDNRPNKYLFVLANSMLLPKKKIAYKYITITDLRLSKIYLPFKEV